MVEATEPVQPGRVLTGPGLEVRTARPKFSVPARFLGYGVTRNPVAEIVFNHEGHVVEARWIVQTRIESIDAPLLASLYEWEAEGERIDDLAEGETLTLQRMKILLVEEPGS